MDAELPSQAAASRDDLSKLFEDGQPFYNPGVSWVPGNYGKQQLYPEWMTGEFQVSHCQSVGDCRAELIRLGLMVDLPLGVLGVFPVVQVFCVLHQGAPASQRTPQSWKLNSHIH